MILTYISIGLCAYGFGPCFLSRTMRSRKNVSLERLFIVLWFETKQNRPKFFMVAHQIPGTNYQQSLKLKAANRKK
jgi:hypothetical protein